MTRCDIIIPIYNAYDCLALCIDSIIRNTNLDTHRIILIDDKSPDERVLPLLKSYENGKNIVLLKNEHNLGFVGTVNRGMMYSDNDVLLLNSDTEVTPNWLDYIIETAYSQPKVASVTSLSNNATLVSVPNGLQPNNLPDGFSLDDYSKLISDISYNESFELPTSHGFCMYIRREALDTVGYFDEETYGRGYGEENDFSYRCLDYGFSNLVCTKSFVLHKESQSFSDSKRKLIEEHEKILNEKYPIYTNRTALWCQQFPLKKVCENIDYQIKLNNRKNVLILIHDWKDVNNNIGGTTLHVYDLIKKLRDKMNFHVLAPEDGIYKLYSYFQNDEKVLKFPSIDNFSRFARYNTKYRSMICDIIDGFRIDTIHVHHLIGHYMDIIDVAKEKNVHSIITLHDFYCLCPTINMLYMMEKCCIDDKNKNCKKCLSNKLNVQNDIVSSWQSDWKNFLKDFDKIIVPSSNTKKYVNKYFKDLNIDVIEHGIDIRKSNYKSVIDEKQFNVAFVGVMAKHKGGKILEELIKKCNNSKVKFHLFGISEFESLDNNKKNYIYHGKYKRDNLSQLLMDNKINLICSFSIWPETYSYTLTEEIASGIPVLAFDIGAVGDRVKKHGFGWTIPVGSDISFILETIDDIINNSDEYSKVIENISKYSIKKTDDMVLEYQDIYSKTKFIKLNSRNAENLRKIIENNYCVNSSISSLETEWILNSLKWRIVSKIKVPNGVKKIVKRVIKK